ncbi:MAG TPA: hypothetical protein VF267_05730 [Gammaproteobacteria bacterium]
MRILVLCFSLLLPSLAAAADVAGLWVGYYAYPPGSPVERVPCALVLELMEGEVDGTMIERQTFGDLFIPGLPSQVIGVLEERTLRLEKYYFHADEQDPAVDYELTLSPDGNVLSGYWSIGELSGTAFFRRVTAESADRIPAPR